MVLCDCCESRGNGMGRCDCTPCFCPFCVLCSQHCACAKLDPCFVGPDDPGEFPLPPVPDRYPPNPEPPPDPVITVAPD